MKLAIREERLTKLARAKAVLEERAKERFEAEQAEYQAKLQEREARGRNAIKSPADPNRNRPNPVHATGINLTSRTLNHES